MCFSTSKQVWKLAITPHNLLFMGCWDSCFDLEAGTIEKCYINSPCTQRWPKQLTSERWEVHCINHSAQWAHSDMDTWNEPCYSLSLFQPVILTFAGQPKNNCKIGEANKWALLKCYIYYPIHQGHRARTCVSLCSCPAAHSLEWCCWMWKYSQAVAPPENWCFVVTR